MEIKMWGMWWGLGVTSIIVLRSTYLGEVCRAALLKGSTKTDPKFTECRSSYPSSLKDSSKQPEFPQCTWGKGQNLLSKEGWTLVPILSPLSTYDRSHWIFISWVSYICIMNFNINKCSNWTIVLLDDCSPRVHSITAKLRRIKLKFFIFPSRYF